MPLTADDPRGDAPLPQYQPRYDDNRPPIGQDLFATLCGEIDH
jgi:hypothetical protein